MIEERHVILNLYLHTLTRNWEDETMINRVKYIFKDKSKK